MLCEKCKIREANIKYTEVINGVKNEHNLCAQCAKEMDLGQYSAIFDGEFPLGKLLSALLGLEESSQKEDKLQQIMCPTCKTTYQEFVENSRFGCPDCYSVFDLLIGDKIKKIQGNGIHTGKRPKYQRIQAPSQVGDGKGDFTAPGLSRKEQLEVLKARLQEAVRKEEYEMAAQYRDEIKSLSQELESET